MPNTVNTRKPMGISHMKNMPPIIHGPIIPHPPKPQPPYPEPPNKLAPNIKTSRAIMLITTTTVQLILFMGYSFFFFHFGKTPRNSMMRWLFFRFAERGAAVGARAPIRINLLAAGGTLCRFETHAATWAKRETLSKGKTAMDASRSAGSRHHVGLRRRGGLDGGLVSLVIHCR